MLPPGPALGSGVGEASWAATAVVSVTRRVAASATVRRERDKGVSPEGGWMVGPRRATGHPGLSVQVTLSRRDKRTLLCLISERQARDCLGSLADASSPTF